MIWTAIKGVKQHSGYQIESLEIGVATSWLNLDVEKFDCINMAL